MTRQESGYGDAADGAEGDRRTSGGSMHVVRTDDAPHHTGPVPQAVRVGEWVFVSALFGVDPASGRVPDDAGEEADQLFANLRGVLMAAGAKLDDVVRVGIFMKNLQRDRPAFNQAWTRAFSDHRPARSAVGVVDFGRPDVSVHYMIEATAVRSG